LLNQSALSFSKRPRKLRYALSAIDARHRRVETGATESLVAVVGIRKVHLSQVPVHQQ
jgi:hypothetical protein